MKLYDIGIAWEWEYDNDFIDGLINECERVGISVYGIEPWNVKDTFQQLQTKKISFRNYFDRASDSNDLFIPIAKFLNESSTHIFNQYKDVEHAKDKATMHLELLTAGLELPYTIIISPYSKKKEFELSLSELAHLGRSFIIKPANTTGGGIGVVVGAETLKEVIETRQHHKHDKYLLQETIHPIYIENKKAWFRGFYAFGKIILCWWDNITHIYKAVSQEEEYSFQLHPLRFIIQKIQFVCQLDFFSSEIAITNDRKFVVIDYVNEICDMRLQSKCIDGVPDEVIKMVQQEFVQCLLLRK